MPPLIFGDIPDDPNLRRFGSDLLPATLGETLGAASGDPRLRPTEMILREAERTGSMELEPRRDQLTPQQRYRAAQRGVATAPEIKPPADLVDEETLNSEYGDIGLKFDRPTSRATADIMAARKREDRIRRDIMARGPSGFFPTVAQFAVALPSAMIDPLNIAAGLFPVIGQARFAGMAARMGVTRARISRGVIEGIVGNAAVEPVIYGLSQRQQLDYTMADALLNVSLGGLIGGGFHAVGGKIGDLLSRAAPEAREAALRSAVAQVADGRAVDIESIVNMELLRTTALTPFRAGDVAMPPTRGVVSGIFETAGFDPATRPGAAPLAQVPVTSQSGKTVPRFNTEAQARFRAQELGLDDATVRPDAEGKFFLAEYRPNIELLRSGDGAPRTFSSRQSARGFLKRQGVTAQELRQTAVIPFEGRFAVVSGLEPEDVARIKAAPSLFDFGRGELPARAALPQPEQKSLAAIAQRESLPERDASADFEAAARAELAPDEPALRADTDAAKAEADFQAEGIAALAVLPSEDIAATLARANERIETAQSLGRAAKAAALCLARVG